MKKIACFCIPAHGHTNPMLPVAAELVRRGNIVRFYSFGEFEKKISATGAEFISCDFFLPKLTEKEEAGLKKVSTTEMTIQDIRITRSMNDFLGQEFQTFRVSESLYMAVPMVLYPQTNEQNAVARRVTEIGAGMLLKDDSCEGIRTAVQEILDNSIYAKAATECSADFRACCGPAGAAEFIEKAPHVLA